MKKAMQKLTALLLASASFLVASPAKASSLADRTQLPGAKSYHRQPGPANFFQKGPVD
ncbi:hypothetical protein ACXO2Q_06135 [Lactobacillus delbrueckii subsp. bulgaricus]